LTLDSQEDVEERHQPVRLIEHAALIRKVSIPSREREDLSLGLLVFASALGYVNREQLL
jgi:hypothetical protein